MRSCDCLRHGMLPLWKHYGGAMATLTLKQVPDDLYRKLKERAVTHRRSLNNEAIHCLEQVFQEQRPTPQEWLEAARTLRRQTPDLFLTEETLQKAKDAGRP